MREDSGSNKNATLLTTPAELEAGPERRRLVISSVSGSRKRRLKLAVTRLFILLAVIFTARYFYWRVTQTINPAVKVFFYIFLAAEILNFVEALLFYFTCWSPTCYKAPDPLPNRSLDLLITTFDEPLELLRETVLCAVDISYPHRTFILDDGDRQEVRALAREFHCDYIARRDRSDAKAGNLNNALAATNGEFIVVLDADHVPSPELIDELLGFFADPRVGLVQATQDFYNLDSFQHRLDRPKRFGWQQQELFFSVIQPGKDRHNAAFYCGSPAMIRRQALEEVGGFATGTITEDMHTSLRLQKRGWRVLYHNQTVARGLAPQTFVGFATQWHRWGYGAMQVLRRENPLFGRGLTISQRICYLGSFYFYWMSYQKLIYILTPVFCLATGIFPLIADPAVFARYFLPYAIPNVVASCLLQGGWRNFILSEEYNLLKIQVLLKTLGGFGKGKKKFTVTPKSRAGSANWKEVSLPLFFVGALTIALIIGAVHIIRGPLGFRFWAFTVNLFWAACYLALLAPAVRRALSRTERRASYRFASSCRLPVRVGYEDASGQYHCIDTHTQNLNRFGLAVPTRAGIPIGTLVKIDLKIDSRSVLALGRIRRHEPNGSNCTNNGIQFESIETRDQDTISKYLFWQVAPREDALLRLTQSSRDLEQ